MDGLEATKLIRRSLSRQPVIIALTANHAETGRMLKQYEDYISNRCVFRMMGMEKWSEDSLYHTFVRESTSLNGLIFWFCPLMSVSPYAKIGVFRHIPPELMYDETFIRLAEAYACVERR